MQHTEQSLSKLKQQHRRLVACFPLYPPVELLHSFGLVPLILWDLKGNVGRLKESDRHLQPFTCSVTRRITEFVLSTEGSLFDGFLMYNACDTLRNMPEIIERGLEERGISRPFLKFHIPMAPARQTDSTEYFADRIHELIIEIENVFEVRFSSERFLASVRVYNAIKKLSLAMENLVAEGRMSYRDFSLIIGKGYFMTPEDYLSALDGAVQKATSNPAKQISGGRKIIVSGILPPPDALCSIIENAGLRVVSNDVASQARSYGHVPRETGDPVAYYSDFYRNHHPCTTLLYSSDERLTLLTGLIEKKDAHGVIFIGEKFCEYEYLEMPFIAKTLKQNNVAMLQLEIATDDHENLEAFRTRIEAFSELIS
jgi:benzoyl-CoA reductase/2-hydroxyglutaryl-CoA dehydratase subunit BcrC/BadD/HgdB